MNVLSLFSGCGGMDLGFEGGFRCLKRSVNFNIHPDWVDSTEGKWVRLKPTKFKTIFANDIREDAKVAWTTYFAKRMAKPEDVYQLCSVVDLVKKARGGLRLPNRR